MDFLIAVADDARLGALRFRPIPEKGFLSPSGSGGYAPIKELRNLMEIADRFFSAEETEDDLQSLLPVATCLGGARPKVSVRDQDGHPAIAKFPKETDDYCIETWEEIALRLANQAAIPTTPHRLIEVSGKRVLLTQRYDRIREQRIPFLSAMAMLRRQDGESASYPEIAEILFLQGSQGKAEAQALYRRMVFNVLISNVDDHLRNHGFLWSEDKGWHLSPAYDLNPVPSDIKARILSTYIDLDDGTCSLDLLEAASGYFELSLEQARSIIRDVATVTATWRNVARATGARGSEISRMASAFEHTELRRALRL
nr:HipA domain-containing protein [Gluconobacter oxydans]